MPTFPDAFFMLKTCMSRHWPLVPVQCYRGAFHLHLVDLAVDPSLFALAENTSMYQNIDGFDGGKFLQWVHGRRLCSHVLDSRTKGLYEKSDRA